MPPLTHPEFVRLCLLAGHLRERGDVEIADAVDAVIRREPDAESRLHDALTVAGRYELADRVRAAVTGAVE